MIRRRLCVTAAACAAVALVGACSERSTPSPPLAGPTASTTTPADPRAWLDVLSVGPPPRIGYVVGHTYYSPGGATLALPRDRGLTSITRLGDGWLATDDRWFEGSRGLFRLGPRGGIAGRERAASGAPVLGRDSSVLYWMTFTEPESGLSRPTLLHRADVASGHQRSVALRRHAGWLATVAGVVGDRVVSQIGWVGHGSSWIGRFGQEPRRLRLRGVVGASPRTGLVTGIGDRDGRVGLVADARARVLWQQRGARLHAFSPSGRLLLASTRAGFAVLDARTGAVRFLLAAPAGAPRAVRRWALAQAAWEDEHRLLVGVTRGRRAAVARVDVRTSAWELAVDLTPLDGTSGVVFETVR